MPSALRTLEQERAKHAWDCVQEALTKPFSNLRVQLLMRLSEAGEDLEKRLRPSDRRGWQNGKADMAR